MASINTHIKTTKMKKEKSVSPKTERTQKSMGQWSKKRINSVLKMYGESRQSLWMIQPKAMEVFRKMIADKRYFFILIYISKRY